MFTSSWSADPRPTASPLDWPRPCRLRFGTASFTLAGETFAHPHTAVVAAGPSPLAADRSVVVFAGLSAEGTWTCPRRFPDRGAWPPRSCSWRQAARSPARHSLARRPRRLAASSDILRASVERCRVRRMTQRSHRHGVARSRKYRHLSGTSISEGPSRSSASRTAAWKLVGPAGPTAGDAIRGGELEKVGVVQIDVQITPSWTRSWMFLIAP